MNTPKSLKDFFRIGADHPALGALELFKYIGPGLLVTVGFIDPGNWAANLAAGSEFGYTLLWVVTVSTIMLIALQHNAAHLGIVTGLCISEAATKHMRPLLSRLILGSAVLAAVSTALAEILGGAIALNMLFHLPIKLGALLTGAFAATMLLTNSYKKLERWIIGFVSVIGLAFIFELSLVEVPWGTALKSLFTPSFPEGAMTIIVSVLGAVVMPHNLFLHSEVIQSRQWNLKDEAVIDRQLKYEFADTLISMVVGWAINAALIILAAATFFAQGTKATELQDASATLAPLLGNYAALVFAIALLCAGFASSITAGVAGGSIFAGIFGEPYDISDKHSKAGVALTFGFGILAIFLLGNPFKSLIYSQVVLSLQLPFTIFPLIYLTSSERIMGRHRNGPFTKSVLWSIGIFVTILNIMLLASI